MAAATSPLGGLPADTIWKQMSAAWKGWFNIAQKVLFATSTSGPTTSRPSPVYVGQFYFDTTLGYPVWAKTLGGAPVWVNGAGTPV